MLRLPTRDRAASRESCPVCFGSMRRIPSRLIRSSRFSRPPGGFAWRHDRVLGHQLELWQRYAATILSRNPTVRANGPCLSHQTGAEPGGPSTLRALPFEEQARPGRVGCERESAIPDLFLDSARCGHSNHHGAKFERLPQAASSLHRAVGATQFPKSKPSPASVRNLWRIAAGRGCCQNGNHETTPVPYVLGACRRLRRHAAIFLCRCGGRNRRAAAGAL